MTDLTIVYDGDGPFCASYVRLAGLCEVAGPIRPVDARGFGPEIEEALAAGHDLDAGMRVLSQDRTIHGAEAVHLLTVLSSVRGGFDRLQRMLFAMPRRAALVYPSLARGRRLPLFLLGRRTFAEAERASGNKTPYGP